MLLFDNNLFVLRRINVETPVSGAFAFYRKGTLVTLTMDFVFQPRKALYTDILRSRALTCQHNVTKYCSQGFALISWYKMVYNPRPVGKRLLVGCKNR